MLETSKYIQNSYSVTFPRQHDVRRKATDVDDFLRTHLAGHYKQPMVIAVPDEMDPEIPRLLFRSHHGFSQIVLSQITLTLHVTYSPDWQVDASKGRQFLLERIPVLYDLLHVFDHATPLFSGLTTRVRLATNADDNSLLAYLQRLVSVPATVAPLYDVAVKVTTVHEATFYSNLTVQNYRTWQAQDATTSLQRLSKRQASERGIEIIGDFNDRLAFNERAEYVSSADVVAAIVDGSFAEVQRMIDRLKEPAP
jgi:hypothetical protein